MEKLWQDDDETIMCPSNDYSCPYWQDSKCTLENVEQECDDFYGYWQDEIDEYFENKR